MPHRTLLLTLLLTRPMACAHRPPASEPPPGAAEVLRVAANAARLPLRATVSPEVCSTITVVASLLDAAADVVDAPAPVLPPLDVDLRGCFDGARPPGAEGAVDGVLVALDLAAVSLVIARLPERDPNAYAIATSAITYARDLVPGLHDLVVDGVAHVPGRPLGVPWVPPSE